MTFVLDTAAKAAFKRLYGRAHTSNSKDIVNESELSGITVAAQNIPSEIISGTAAAAMSSGVVTAVTIPLILDGSSGGKSYHATISGSIPSGLIGKINPLTGSVYNIGQRVGFFVPDNFGADFRVRLKDGSTEIPPLAAQDWIFDYYSGIITSEDNLSLSSGSVDGYIYIGRLLSDTADNWTKDGYGNIYNTNSLAVQVENSLSVGGSTTVSGSANISGNTVIGGNVAITGQVIAGGDAFIGGDGYVSRDWGALGDGYVLGNFGIGGVTNFVNDSRKFKLFINDGSLAIARSTGPSLDLIGSGNSSFATQGTISFGSTNSTIAPLRRIASVVCRSPIDFDVDAGELALATANSSGTLSDRINITKDGYVGINTLAPTELLEISSSTSRGPAIKLNYADTTWTIGDVLGRIDWAGNDGSAGASGVRARLEAVATGTAGATKLKFWTTADSSTTLNQVVTVSHDLKVGIGVDPTGLTGALQINGGRISLSSGGDQWAVWGSAAVATSYMTFYQGATTTPVGYVGTDGGGILAGGSGTHYGIRAEADLLFASGGASERARITSGGNFGIGATASFTPTSFLDVRGSETGVTLPSNAVAAIVNTEASVAFHSVLYLGMAENPTSSADRFITCCSNTTGTSFGTVEFYVDGQGGTGTSLTAQHWVVLDSDGMWRPGIELKPGMILSSTGTPWIRRDMETAIPIVKIANTKDDKTVFGVLSSNFSSAYDLGLWNLFEQKFNDMSKSPDPNPGQYSIDSTYFKARANSGGEGQIWISDIYGDVQNGDYITTSEIPGYGGKQDDDVIHSYTVAKCTESIDWNNVVTTTNLGGQTYKIYLATCTYHCG